PERLVGVFAARESDDGGARVEELPLREAEEGGDELSMREVPGGAEDDERAGIGGSQRDALLAERIRPGLGLGRHGAAGAHSVITGCPPNLWRRAASTLAWKESLCRERNRDWSARVRM